MRSPLSFTTSPRESFTEEERQAVAAQLDRLLANPFFSHSRRFPSFLRYVVDHTLAGDTDNLKERTLGIEIFGKDADYDTASDPIVRVTAAEIRKRIALYYQGEGHENELRVGLPPGSYIPTFRFPPFEPPAPDLAIVPSLEIAASQRPAHSPTRTRTRQFILTACALMVIMAIGGFFAWRHSRQTALGDFWGPILGSSDPVLFCVADQTQYTAIALRDAQDPSKQVVLKDNLTAVVIDDLSTIIKIAGVVQGAGKHFNIMGEGRTNLSDLRNGPSVIIGAFDNAWTLRLLQPLRYHFANNPEMTAFSILDSNAPAKPKWVVDRTQQFATNNYRDYAIVARFTDKTTGQPTLVAAGIGRGGTIAAGEFLTSPDLLQIVRTRKPPNLSNVEVVLSTQIIDGEPGTPAVEAVYFW
jgi:hypothetical protein